MAAATPIADVVEIHTHILEGELTKMRPVNLLEPVPWKNVKLYPGGRQIMLIGLCHPLEACSSFPLTLMLKHADSVLVNVAVGVSSAIDPD